DVWSLVLTPNSNLRAEWMPELLNGVMVIRGDAFTVDGGGFGEHLYMPIDRIQTKARRVQFTAIPYYAWANREARLMTIWIRHPTIGEIQKLYN
ncbi:hypothetical protein DRO55_04760, partial [Candidatus Bathyarchaeota archaeon]